MAEPYEIETEDEEYIEVDPSMATEEIQAAVQQAIEDAVDYIDNTISPVRATAAEYYNGEPLGNEQEGRSTAQTMDVRDTVQAMLPSLMRIFCGSDHVVEYAPTGPEDVEMAKQATDYVNYILNQDQDMPYIEIIYSAMKDALVKGQGFLKYYFDETETTQSYELENLDDQALNALNADPDIEIDMLMSVVSDESPEPLHKVRVTKRNKIGKVKVMSVPPEEVLINRTPAAWTTPSLWPIALTYRSVTWSRWATTATRWRLSPPTRMTSTSLTKKRASGSLTSEMLATEIHLAGECCT